MTKHELTKSRNEEIWRFVRDFEGRSKVLENCIRFLIQQKAISSSRNLPGKVEMCYLRQLFNFCENNSWSLPDVISSMQTENASRALFIRLRFAVIKCENMFEEKRDKLSIVALKAKKLESYRGGTETVRSDNW